MRALDKSLLKPAIDDGRRSLELTRRDRDASGTPPIEQLRVIEFDWHRDPRWQHYVTRHPDGLIYHHPLWLQVIEQSYGHKALALACEDGDGELRGVLPLCQTQGLAGKRLVSLPHTPIAGPLSDGDSSAIALARAAIACLQRQNCASLELKLPSPALASRLEFMAAKPWDSTYVLNLPPSGQALRFGESRNHGRLNWSIKKAARLAVQARWAESLDDLRRWYRLYLDTMRRHAVPPRPYVFFETAWNLLHARGMLRLLLAEKTIGLKDRLIAGSIFLPFGRTVFYAFNGRRETDLSFRPNDLIQWTAIHEFYREGFRHYDFGEVDPYNRGLAEFKQKWGAEPKPLVRVYHPISTVSGPMSRPETMRRLMTSIWRRLPLSATEILGRWIYRHI